MAGFGRGRRQEGGRIRTKDAGSVVVISDFSGGDIKMNENAKKWIIALRSGEYKQGRLALHPTYVTFCCLGVGCDIYIRDVGGCWDESYGFQYGFKYGFHAYDGYSNGIDDVLPVEVQNWLGLASTDGAFISHVDDSDFVTLAELNDSGEYNFDRIADIIESEPKGLFVNE